MLSFLKSLVPTSIKRRLLIALSRAEMPLPSGQRVFLFLAADYGNIGDIAITTAQQNFLECHAAPRTVVPVPISRTAHLIRFLRRNARPDDLITIVGGGNMGALYPEIEFLRQLVIRSFPDNRIICFPQTLDWKKDGSTQHVLDRIVRTYSAHRDIHLFARESISRDKLTELFAGHPNIHVGYCPDIVMSATANSLGSAGGDEPDGILLALRDDRERVLNDDEQEKVAKALAASGLPVTVTDTHGGGWGLERSVRDRMLTDKINEFRAARIVVTDRLHGMILAAIAGTPCLVLPSASHKLYQTWDDWLSDVPQVTVLSLDDLDAVSELVTKALAMPRRDPDCALIDHKHYAPLAQTVSA